MKLMVYSHDTYGLGNIRRMLAICDRLLAAVPELSILLVSGAPMLHSFRMSPGLDYIKLPCLRRDESGALAATYLDTDMEATVRWRSDSIRAAAANFKPDLLLVDKKPHGLQGELHATLDWLEQYAPKTKLVLLLRDILYGPAKTRREWAEYGYLPTLERRFDSIWVMGDPAVFDLRREYRLPAAVAAKVRFCGYLRKPHSSTPPAQIRRQLGVRQADKLVLVTPGGGQDGFQVVSTYLDALNFLPEGDRVKSAIICGPDMPLSQRQQLEGRISAYPDVTLQDFTDDLMGYMAAADVVVSMTGYNTTCEILSLGKRAVMVPRVKPVLEQLIRADCLARLGLVEAIHPQRLSPELMAEKLHAQLSATEPLGVDDAIDMNGLECLGDRLEALFPQRLFQPRKPAFSCPTSTFAPALSA